MLRNSCKKSIKFVLFTIGRWSKYADIEKRSNETHDYEDPQDDDNSYIESVLAYAFANIDNFILGRNKTFLNPEVAADIKKVAKSAFFNELYFSDTNTRDHSAVCAIKYIIKSAKSNTWGFDPKNEMHQAKFEKIALELLIFSKLNYRERVKNFQIF